MKKIFISMFAVMAMFAMTACGGGSNNSSSETSSETSSEPKASDWKEAVEQGDFEAAHKFLDEMHSKFNVTTDYVRKDKVTTSYGEYLTALEKVYTAEIKDLLLNDPKGAMIKIPFFLSDIPMDGNNGPIYYHERIKKGEDVYQRNIYIFWCTTYNKICRYALEQAVNTGNYGLAKKIVNLFRDNLRRDFGYGGTLDMEKLIYFEIDDNAKRNAQEYYDERKENNYDMDDEDL